MVSQETPGERKRTGESVEESERKFRMLVDQAGDAFFVHDYAGKIYDVNRQACETLGYSREELLNMRIIDIDIEIRAKKHVPRFWERLAAGQYITFEGIQRRKTGETLPVEVRLGRLDIGERKFLLSLCRGHHRTKAGGRRTEKGLSGDHGLKEPFGKGEYSSEA
jgi:PAS domain S-box